MIHHILNIFRLPGEAEQSAWPGGGQLRLRGGCGAGGAGEHSLQPGGTEGRNGETNLILSMIILS